MEEDLDGLMQREPLEHIGEVMEASSVEDSNHDRGITESYVNAFLFKYVCPKEQCAGTVAPIFGSDKCVCNMCGFSRTEAEFAKEMEDYC